MNTAATTNAQMNNTTQIPKNSRIGVIGAGPAGVSFTYFLRKQGFNNITLLESAPHISGKSSSFEVGGRGYDVGALMVGTNYHHIRSLASQLSCPLEPFKGRALDIDNKKLIHEDTSVICVYQELLPHINHYLGERSHTKEIANPGHGVLSEEMLFSPIEQYLKGKQMGYLRDAWALAFTSAGYGYIDSGDIPAAYFLKFIEASENNISYFPEGFCKLWEKMVDGINVITNAHVTKVDRSLAKAGVGPILVTFQSQYEQTLAFDYLIVATNPRQAEPFLDVTPEEELPIFKQIVYFDYYTIIATVDGLSTKQGLTTIPKYCQSKEYVGHITAFYCAYDGVPTYSFYAYGNEQVSQENVLEYFREDIEKMGGSLKEIHYCKHWDFFPHVNSLSMARGFYSKAEHLQGKHNTFYTGGWLDLELTETCVSYSKDLVTRFFSDTPKESQHLPISPPIEVKPPAMENLALTLKLAAEKYPEKVAFTWVNANLEEEMRFTYAQLYQQARQVAQFLVTNGHKKGDRVLLCYAPGLKFLPILFGCFMCGVIAVPVAPPNLSTAQKDIARFSYLTTVTGARICFSEKDYLLYTKIYASKALVGLVEKIKWPEGLTWIDGESISKTLYDEALIAEVDPHDVAVLQFSSGSTGDPKGVMLTHRNLLHNVDLMQAETGINTESIFAFWVPQFHDLGLIGGFLNTVRAASRSIVMSPLTFLQRPEVWLQMISKYRANFTAAPNFAYELAARKCSDKTLGSLDLSSLIGAFNGAEPVRWSTLHAFSQKFSNAGFDLASFKCLYGLAEHCAYTCGFRNSHGVPTVIDVDPQDLLSGCVTIRSNPSMPNRIVATGVPNTAMQVEVRIVDPDTRLLCPPNVVGEVWISSPSVGEGYYGKEELSEEVFRAKLHSDDDQDRDRGCFLRTGDLGFMYKGQLYITGRLKDVIIINGKNHYPHDVELTVQQCHPRVRPGCVAALHHHDPSRGTDALIILAEIRDDRDKVGLGTIVHEISRMVPANHGLSPERIVLLKPHTIPKTTSGKLQRARAKALLMAGELDKKILFNDGDLKEKEKAKPVALAPIAVTLSHAQICETITRRVQKISKLVPQSGIDENANLITTYGLDSLAAVQLTSSLKDDFKVEIPPSLLYDIPTISGLAKHVAKLSAVQKSESTTDQLVASPSSSPTFVPSIAEIESTISAHIQKLSRIAAKLEKPDPNANIITDYGFDSLSAVQLTALIKTTYKVEVAPAILYDIYTIRALASHVFSLVESQSAPQQRRQKNTVQDHEILTPKETPLLVPLAPRNVSNKNNPPLFCIHPLLGNVAAYVHLSRVVGITRPVFGIQSPTEFPPSIAILAKRYAALIQRDQPSGPYYLCGYSYGGLIAWEIGKHLVASGERIGGLFLIDAPSPLAQTVKEPLSGDKEAHLVWKEEIEQLLSDIDSKWMMRGDQQQIEDLKRLIGGHIQAMYAYTDDISTLAAVQPFPVHYWRAKDLSKTSTLLLDHPDFHDPYWGWRQYKGSITFYNPTPGHHYSVLTDDNCPRLSRELDRAIPKYNRRTSAELRPLMLDKVASKDRRSYITRSCKSSNSLLDVLNAQIPLYYVIAITIAISYTMQRITTIVI